ncbi:MAG: DUF547 domain-containing protein, partial [Ginsengibacter sp.]
DAYKKGNTVADFQFTKILNYHSTAASLNDLKSQLTVIDFFGTWCVPCVRALPHLKELQNKFKNKLSVILVSNEDEGKLTKFINARLPFPFPVIADPENKFISLFQPPSYPYTIVLNNNNEIVDVTDAASLTAFKLNEFLNQKTEDIKTSPSNIVGSSKNLSNEKSSNPLVNLSQQFIYAAKTGDSVSSLINQLKNISFDTLVNDLKTDNEKKAFWINLYNGYTQELLKQNPGKYKHRNKFFKSKQIEVAGKKFSLDEIEHGILRHSKIKWSLGYLNKLFPGKTEKELRVDTLDYRIHFALNCGAKSCPPIAFYNDETLNHQLDLATKAYLTGESKCDSTKNIIYLPALMNWFRRDFGGKKGMKKLLKKIDLIPAGSNPKIKFKKYDWNLFLNHYKTDN